MGGSSSGVTSGSDSAIVVSGFVSSDCGGSDLCSSLLSILLSSTIGSIVCSLASSGTEATSSTSGAFSSSFFSSTGAMSAGYWKGSAVSGWG